MCTQSWCSSLYFVPFHLNLGRLDWNVRWWMKASRRLGYRHELNNLSFAIVTSFLICTRCQEASRKGNTVRMENISKSSPKRSDSKLWGFVFHFPHHGESLCTMEGWRECLYLCKGKHRIPSAGDNSTMKICHLNINVNRSVILHCFQIFVIPSDLRKRRHHLQSFLLWVFHFLTNVNKTSQIIWKKGLTVQEVYYSVWIMFHFHI